MRTLNREGCFFLSFKNGQDLVGANFVFLKSLELRMALTMMFPFPISAILANSAWL